MSKPILMTSCGMIRDAATRLALMDVAAAVMTTTPSQDHIVVDSMSQEWQRLIAGVQGAEPSETKKRWPSSSRQRFGKGKR